MGYAMMHRHRLEVKEQAEEPKAPAKVEATDAGKSNKKSKKEE